MNTKKSKVAVIVPTRNSIQNIEKCLKSIEDQTYPCELAVVDNNSTDGTFETAKKFTKNVFTKGPERSTQRNFGVLKTKSDYLLFVDSDMVLDQNVVSDCVKLCDDGCDAVIIEEKFYGKGFWSKCKSLEKSLYFGTGDGEAARFFKRDVFVKLRMYNEGLIGTEDIDLHKRLKKGGFKVCYGRKLIYHSDEGLTLMMILKKRVYYALTLDLYLKLNKEESKSEIKFVRYAFIKNWRKLVSDPLHAIGLFFMRFLEFFAVVYGLIKSKNAEDAARKSDNVYGVK